MPVETLSLLRSQIAAYDSVNRCLHMLLCFSLLFFPQSCHDEEDEDGEEVKSFEVGDQSRFVFICQSLVALAVDCSATSCQTCLVFHMNRRRRWRSRSCCISRLGFMTEELLRWCFKPSVLAKVGSGPPSFFLDSFGHRYMVDCTYNTLNQL